MAPSDGLSETQLQEDRATKRKPLAPHWYMRYITECPICGRGYDVRERRFDPKPDDPADRVDYNGMAYDWCDAL